jgi:hypothetical protein
MNNYDKRYAGIFGAKNYGDSQSHLHLPANVHRYALWIFPARGEGVTWKPGSAPAASSDGIYTGGNITSPVVLCVDEVGDWIQQEWYIRQDAGSNGFSWIDVIY